jgi:hypothetical protein
MWKGGTVADNSTALVMNVRLSNSYTYTDSFNGFAFVHLFLGLVWLSELHFSISLSEVCFHLHCITQTEVFHHFLMGCRNGSDSWWYFERWKGAYSVGC